MYIKKKMKMEKVDIYYSKENKKLKNNILYLMNTGKYTSAMDLIRKKLETIQNDFSIEALYIKMQFAGFLIDIGTEAFIFEASINGLKIYLEYETIFRKMTLEFYVEYNFGNAKKSIFNLRRIKEGYNEDTIRILNEAKNHYWKSYKLCQNFKNDIEPFILVNLGTSLSACGRIVEALQCFDSVISKYSKFPNAHACRSDELVWLNNLSQNVLTINLIYQITNGFDIASQSKELPSSLINIFLEKKNYFKKMLEEHNHTKESVHKDLIETEEESKMHSNYRKFCISNHLCLSEHSLYCNCIGARRDDLAITPTHEPLSAVFLPPMEQMLNRLKSEFSIARLLLYKSYAEANEQELETFDSEVVFVELFDGEEIGTKSEMLRTSFRLCFGILDKIAMAVCKLFDLDEENENIYFESFWKPKGNSEKKSNRWKKIIEIQNISLFALYTQAHDLNTNSGEWRKYKKWRNLLEHNFMILTDSKNDSTDKFNIEMLNSFVERIDYNEFKERTLHLLQLTRSAIFNFTFMVRKEAKKINNKSGNYISHTFTYKNDPEEKNNLSK
jgi:hypothetical protein